MKWKSQVIQLKIKKYKRRLRAALKRRAKRLELLQVENPISDIEKINENVSINSEEDFETTTSDREAEERAQFLKKIEEERRQKIFYAKISYNCRDLKLPKLLTSLHQKEISASFDFSPRVSNSFKPKKKSIPLFEVKRRVKDTDEPSYMRATVSYNLGRFDAKNNESADAPVLNNFSIRDKSTLMDPTKTYLLKVAKKRAFSIDDREGKYINNEMRTSSPNFISVSIQEKTSVKTSEKNSRPKGIPKKLEKKPKNKTIGITLPDISTKYQQMPLKVKPRTSIMKGFAKTRQIPLPSFD